MDGDNLVELQPRHAPHEPGDPDRCRRLTSTDASHLSAEVSLDVSIDAALLAVDRGIPIEEVHSAVTAALTEYAAAR